MRILGVCLLLASVILLLPGASAGQDGDENDHENDARIFTGRGINSSRYQAPQPKASKIRWPKLWKSSNGERSPRKERSFKNLFSKNPSSGFRKKKGNTGQDDFGQRQRPLSGLGDLFSKRDPDRPTMFQQFNANSKKLFNRTSDWAQQTNDGIRNRSYDTWNAITRNRGNSNEEQEDPIELTKPPVRSGNSMLRKRKVRF